MEVIQQNWRARVKNLSDKPYDEVYNDRKIHIPAHGEVIFEDWNDAVNFRGTFIPAKKDEMGRPITEKRIVVEKIWDKSSEEKIVGYQNPITGHVFSSKEEMEVELRATRTQALEVKEEPTKAIEAVVEKMNRGFDAILSRLEKIESSSSTSSKPKRASKLKAVVETSNEGEGIQNATAGDHRRR